ncbi:MAG: uroporphyrinogen-III synthase [Neisseriales bacterium]|nr:MAG: uroporphyrinogen-III synthase [Neisseriales bacterium]
MYLVARQESQSYELIELLTASGYPATWLPLMTTRLNTNEYHKLIAFLNNYNTIFITAPAVIDYLAEEIPKLSLNINILTTGLASATKIRKISEGLKIVYPVFGSGIDAIEKEQLFKTFNNSRMLIIGGDTINLKLEALLNKHNIEFYYSSIYERINLALESPDMLDKYLSNQAITGIIITSKQIAEYLLQYISTASHMERLKKLFIISIHKQITEYLCENGLSNVRETANSDNLSILQTIRDFENERTAK